MWKREDGSAMHEDRRFRQRLLYTRPGTSIDPSKDIAQDASLRETECLQTHWRPEASKVAVVGYIFADKEMMERLKILHALFLGGDSRYGLGKVQRVDIQQAKSLFDLEVRLDADEAIISGKRILGHAYELPVVAGAKELLDGWDFGKRIGTGKNPNAMWMPGSCSESRSWSIGENGIWKVYYA
jgi:hypothetical protein